MGFRRLCLLLALPFALSFTACGDNDHKVFEDAGIDSPPPIDAAIDAPDTSCTGAGQMVCSGTCVNTNNDNNNCGSCGNSCGNGTCQSGLCCPTGQTNCGGTCIDLTASNTHCGSCTNDCGSSATCQTNNGFTLCCPTGQTNCNGQCVDLDSDEAHCGSCATACGTGDTCCTGSCKNTQTDNSNCGACGTTCDTSMGDTCKGGTPAACCGTNETNCSGSCSTLADDMNCGACGAACNTGAGQSCKAPTTGTTVACCTASQNNCGGSCSDPMTDEANCGGCAGAGGVACAAGDTCLSGVCCGPGEVNCNGVCVDTLTDAANCGGCTGSGGTACGGTTPVCNGGTCAGSCDILETECNGDCVNTSSDHNNCGSCGNACAGNQVCSNGTCTTTCGTGLMNCNGSCVSVSNDPNHCGSCTNVCPLQDECVAGNCQLDCPTGQQLCNGACVDTLADEANCGGCAGSGGMVCGTGQTCDSGLCCGSGQENVNGKCCPTGWLNCNNQCVDPKSNNANCGTCGHACSNSTCDNGICCAANLDNCNGTTCTDTQTDEANCGACNAACASTETCTAGLCCDTLTEYNANGICCPLGSVNCNGVCKNLNDHDTCGTSCANAGMCQPNEVCQAGTCNVSCTGGQIACFGACVDTQTNVNNCGSCGNVCAAGQTCSGGVCSACPASAPSECEPPVNACVNPVTDVQNCGGCSTFCGSGEHCSATNVRVSTATESGTTATFTTATAHFLAPGNEVIVSGMSVAGYNGAWQVLATPTLTTFTATLPAGLAAAVGVSISTATETGSTATFTTSSPHLLTVGTQVFVSGVSVIGYNGAWTVVSVPTSTTFTATLTKTGLANGTGGSIGAVSSGDCCGFGLEACNGQCLDYRADPNNCGSCGNACGAGSVCINGACQCGFGQIQCGTNCITPSVDPLNCGSCGTVCGNGKYCVSGGCVASCPAPLTGCGNGATAECVNTNSDSDNCGACGNKCPANQGCSAGQCVPKLTLGTDPAKCVGGGPPIDVPDDTGTVCTGSLGATSFTFGLCARTNIGPVSRDLITDAFDSTSGPYVATCTTNANCGPQRCRITHALCTSLADCPTAGDACDYPVKCVGGTCAGGGVGVNGIDDGVSPPVAVGPVASNSATTHVGGAFWVFGTIGLAVKGATQVKQKFYNQANLDLSKSTHVWGEATVGGAWSSGGNTSMTIDQTLHIPATGTCPPLGANVLTLNGSPACSTDASFANLKQPCGARADLVDVKKIVRFFSNAANNDNSLIGLNQAVLDNPATSLRIDLPCGVYYLNSINAGKSITIVVHGRTALVIGGAIRISQQVIFDVEPNASLDIFAGGVLNVSNDTTLGSPAYPRLTRLYLGDDSCKGGSAALTTGEDFTDCCSGVASGGFCVGGGGNLAQSISLSQGGHFNGLLWGGYGTFTHSNPLEMYGSIFTNHFDASGDTIVHFDNGVVRLGDECPQPTSCGSCRDCNNQACINGQCSSCTSDSQCCPPLVCRGGTCVLE